MFAAIVAVIAIIVSVIVAARAAKTPSSSAQSLDENSLPITSETATIPVIFGTRIINQSNVVGYGNFYNQEVKY